MALILALNPGNQHSPTLARLARELPGCELIGAETSPVAINAIKKRVPDVVLLPANQARGQADLLAHLKTIPGGVLTLKLPPVESADPTDLARQIREMLTGVPADVEVPEESPREAEAPLETSAHLLAAAAAAAAWARARREQWSNERPQEIVPPPVLQSVAVLDSPEEYQPYEPIEPSESDYPYPTDTPDEPQPRADYGAQLKAWLPRLGGVAAAIAVIAAIILYWPKSGEDTPTTEQVAAPEVPAPVDANPTPVEPAPTAKPEPEADPLAKVSGWVAVFSPFEVSISERGIGVQMDDRGRTMLPPGRHRLRFQNSGLGYDETLTVDVKPADTTTVNLNPQTTLGVTSSAPAEVLIDGTRAGDTPFEGKISLGPHTVTVKTAEAERERTIDATSKPVQLEIDFSQP